MVEGAHAVLKKKVVLTEQQIEEIRGTQQARVNSWLDSGDLLMRQGKWQEAIGEYEKVTKHPEWNLQNWKWKPAGGAEEPALPYALEKVAEANRNLGYDVGAERALAKAGEMRGELDAFLAGVEAMAKGDNELSKEFFRNAMLLNKKSSISMLQLVNELEQKGDLEGAAKRLDEILKRDKDCVEALQAKLELSRRRGDVEAEKEAGTALANLIRREKWKPIEVTPLE